jgi:hypothetical protein
MVAYICHQYKSRIEHDCETELPHYAYVSRIVLAVMVPLHRLWHNPNINSFRRYPMSRLLRLSTVLALMAIVLSFGISGRLLAQSAVTFTFGPGRDAVQPGTVTLTPKGNQTEIVVNAQPGAAGVAQPGHVHEGGCPGVGPVKYPLTNIVEGKSTTTVDASINDLLSGAYSINLHRSQPEIQIYTACTNLTRAAAPSGAAPSTGAAPTTGAGATSMPRTGTAGILDTNVASTWPLAIGAGVVLLGAIGLAYRRTR